MLPDVMMTVLQKQCGVLRSLHRPGAPLVLPNAWDVATAKAVVAAGFPVVATTSGGVAAALGFEDHEAAPAHEMLAAAARIGASVDVPVTVDAEAGYGIEPAELVAVLRNAGAAGCNLEDTDHARGELRDTERHARWLGAVREAAADQGYDLVINARTDIFLPDVLAGARRPQARLVPEAAARAHAYLQAGADCVFPIALWDRDAIADFTSRVAAPVNVLAAPRAPSRADLAEMGVARISYATFLHRAAMQRFAALLETLADPSADGDPPIAARCPPAHDP
jgi:2-methylisocitrate lyase-like PEP mutase family enzyme